MFPNTCIEFFVELAYVQVRTEFSSRQAVAYFTREPGWTFIHNAPQNFKSLVAEHIMFARNQNMFFCHMSTLKMVKGEKWVLTVLSFEYHLWLWVKNLSQQLPKRFWQINISKQHKNNIIPIWLSKESKGQLLHAQLVQSINRANHKRDRR